MEHKENFVGNMDPPLPPRGPYVGIWLRFCQEISSKSQKVRTYIFIICSPAFFYGSK